MTHRAPLLLAVFLALGLVLALMPVDAQARGGRYSAPRASPERADEPPPPDEDPSTAATTPPPPTVEAPRAAVPATGEMPRATGSGLLSRGRRGAWYAPGKTSWIWWYEANRERFEDLRRRRFQTPDAPLFGVGMARGPMIGNVTIRVSPRLRQRLLDSTLDVVDAPEGEWIHTQAAALVALGKLAETGAHVNRLVTILSPAHPSNAYLKESAALGIGQLRRSDPSLQLAPHVLDRARLALVATLGDDTSQPRTRAFAALAIGLLGNQPSARGDAGDDWAAETLFKAWTDGELPDEVQVGILMGMVRLPAAAISSVMRLVLEGCAIRGRHWDNAPSTLVRSHAILSLAELGTAKNARALATLLDPDSDAPSGLRQATALAAAVLGERHPDARPLLGRAVLEALESTKEPGARHTLWTTLGRLLAADARVGATELLDDAKAGARLLRGLDQARLEERPFVAMALAIAVRTEPAVENEPYAWHAFRTKAITALRDALPAKGADVQNRGAIAVALGLVRDRASTPTLLALLEDLDASPELRAYAALGLGLIGDGRREVVAAVTAAVRDPRDRVLQMRAATALGLLGGGMRKDRDAAIEILLDEMRRSRDQVVKGQMAITLARIGDAAAITPLIGMAGDANAPHLNRAMAVAALGLIGDCEIHPVLAASRWNSHYLSHSSVVRDILDTL